MIPACKLTRAGYESADYSVVRKSGSFEIRDYPTLVVVSAPISATSASSDNGFRQLFRYISGNNEAQQKIAMTTPVFSDQEGPDRKMSFVVPVDVASKGPPRAKSEEVILESRRSGRFAVYRFSGGRNPDRVRGARLKLDEWMKSEKLTPSGEVVLANYDPPFTPAFLRRNE
ncbi:MAG: SOUL family heme-binding protein, partial [Blastocatellia bacterium]